MNTPSSEKRPVLRLARTFPRVDAQGIGLHCYYYTRYSRRPSVILTKAMDSPPLPLREDTEFHEIAYKDLTATAERLGFFRMMLIGMTKSYGEFMFLKKAIRLVQRLPVKPAVIHVHSANYLFAGLALKALYRIPVCLNFGGTELVRARRLWPYRAAFRQLDAAFYVANAMERDLHQFMPPEKCVYTANGFDSEAFGLDNLPRHPRIVAVGNLRWQKDYPTMLHAFAIVVKRFPQYELRIFGEGPERAQLERMIRELRLERKVVLAGMRSQEELRREMNSADLFLMSSKSEGLPKAMIEAMACGLPVVCTDVGDCDMVRRDAGLCVPPENPNALAEAVSELLSNRRRLEKMRGKAVTRSRDFSWRNVANCVDEVYNKISAE